jgi:hypothetical protein
MSHEQPRANKTDAGNGSNGICRVSDASRSPSPDPKRSGRSERHSIQIDQLAEFGVGWVLGFD